MWTYIFGPILAFFPAPWRKAMSWAEDVHWSTAATVSGIVEVAFALVALSYWYNYAMVTWVDRGVSGAMRGNLGPGVAPQEIGTVALMILITHPLTWLLGYFVLEGVVRFFAGLTVGGAYGILPFFLIDKIFIGPFRPRNEKAADAPASARALVSSYVGAICEKVTTASHSEVRDEIRALKNSSGETLEIYASRKKADWTPPRVVRYLGGYYRLEEGSGAPGPRPFRYVLRRLPMGVPGRMVLDYAPFDPVIRNAS